MKIELNNWKLKTANWKLFTFLLCSLCYSNLIAQTKSIKPDFSDEKNFRVVNRNINIIHESQKIIVHLDGKPNDGVAWITNASFGFGSIEFDVKGKDVIQQSFVGIAFHGTDDSAYDVVYFRPFNFQSPDSLRKKHQVQYISLPKFDWEILRQKFTGVYENNITQNILPTDWFHAKVVIKDNSITVYVNEDEKASLVVKPISKTKNGKIGFWVGNNSDGDFANLVIKSDK
jgi:hypothetical protein